MTVAFVDTPGVPLSAPDAPVRFTATEPVPALSVRFGSGRVEERVYRDGAFVFPYATSTKVGNTYTVRRTGGWPTTPTVYIDELAPPPTIPIGGQPMGAVYTVDFRTLPSQTLTAPGAYTIDGLTWWAKVALTGQPYGQHQANVLTNGLGLGLASLYAGGTRIDSTPEVLYRHLFLPFANIPGYNPLAPMLLRWHVSQSALYNNEHQMVVGICSTTNDAVGLQAVDRQYDHFIVRYNGGGGHRQKRGTAGLTTAIYFTDTNNGNREYGIYRYLGEYGMEVSAPAGNSWAGDFIADINTLVVNTATLAAFGPKTRPNPGVFVAIEGQIDTTMLYLTHLQIMQPKVAA
jgi:hypothetical protein